MPYNGTGIFLRVRRWVNDAAANIKIRADFHDSEDDNFAQGLTMAITRDGQSTILANLPMSGFRHTNVASGQSRNEYATIGQVQDNSVNSGVISGSVNAYVLTPSFAITSYVVGQMFWGKINITNTGSSTLNVSGIGTKPIKSFEGVDVVSGELTANKLYGFYYDGTNFILSGSSQFNDLGMNIVGSSDVTKKVKLEVDGLTTATTRTLTVQDFDGTVYVTGGQDVSIADGGTGASTKILAFNALSPTTTAGDISYRNATDNVRLGIGTSAQVLGSTGTAPAWVNGPGWTYESPEQTITANTVLTLTHGLGYLPRDVQIVIRNKTTEFSWVAADEVILCSSGIQNNTGIGIGMNTTSLFALIPTAIWVFHRNNPANFNAITVGNWRIVVRAR